MYILFLVLSLHANHRCFPLSLLFSFPYIISEVENARACVRDAQALRRPWRTIDVYRLIADRRLGDRDVMPPEHEGVTRVTAVGVRGGVDASAAIGGSRGGALDEEERKEREAETKGRMRRKGRER